MSAGLTSGSSRRDSRILTLWTLGEGQLRYTLPRRCGVTFEYEGLMT
jgi:hypothetical protein